MKNVFRIETISQLNDILGNEKAKHPLVSIINFDQFDTHNDERMLGAITSSFYTILLKNKCNARMRYGREYYDFQEGTLVCIAPEQILTMEEEEESTSDYNGWGIFFHPDLLRGTHLSQALKNYSFFSYATHEALHLSDKEKSILNNCINNIEEELDQNIDLHSQSVIVSNIELLLNYCKRFYDRQFITRKSNNKDILSKFEDVVNTYINSESIKTQGMLSVKYCAEKLHLSANYLSDLLKKETGKNAQDHISYQLIETAKNCLLISTDPVSEIAYGLGFEYPQYFSKLFKKKTGMTPNEYRRIN